MEDDIADKHAFSCLDLANFEFDTFDTDVPIDSIIPSVAPSSDEMPLEMFNFLPNAPPPDNIFVDDGIDFALGDLDLDFDDKTFSSYNTQSYVPITENDLKKNESKHQIKDEDSDEESDRRFRRQSVRIQDRTRRTIADRIRQENLRLEKEACRMVTSPTDKTGSSTSGPVTRHLSHLSDHVSAHPNSDKKRECRNMQGDAKSPTESRASSLGPPSMGASALDAPCLIGDEEEKGSGITSLSTTQSDSHWLPPPSLTLPPTLSVSGSEKSAHSQSHYRIGVEQELTLSSVLDAVQDLKEDFAEDDPEKLWCICQQAHGYRFMICCDKCSEWFHGDCVGITVEMGQQMEETGVEFQCPRCLREQRAIDDCLEGLHSPVAPPVLQREPPEEEYATRQRYSSGELQTQSSTCKTQSTPGIASFGTQAEASSVQQSLTEAKVSDFLKPVVVLTALDPVLQKLSLEHNEVNLSKDKKTSKSHHRDKNRKRTKGLERSTKPSSVVPTNTSKPSPISTSSTSVVLPSPSTSSGKKHHKEVASSKKQTSESASTASHIECLGRGCGSKVKMKHTLFCSTKCIERYAHHVSKINRREKQQKYGVDKGRELSRLQHFVMLERKSGNVLSGKKAPKEENLVQFLKSRPTYEVITDLSVLDESADSPVPEVVKVDKEEPIVKEESVTEPSSKKITNPVRLKIRQMFFETLRKRIKEAGNVILTQCDFLHRVVSLEEALFRRYDNDVGLPYQARARLLNGHLKDTRNEGLFRRLLSGEIPPDRMIAMTNDQLSAPQIMKAPDVPIGGHVSKSEPIHITSDTTKQHSQHLFDVNCKICSGKKRQEEEEEATMKEKHANQHKEKAKTTTEKQSSSSLAFSPVGHTTLTKCNTIPSTRPPLLTTSSTSARSVVASSTSLPKVIALPPLKTSTPLLANPQNIPVVSSTSVNIEIEEGIVTSTVRTPELSVAPSTSVFSTSGVLETKLKSNHSSRSREKDSSTSASTPAIISKTSKSRKATPVWKGELKGETGTVQCKAFSLSCTYNYEVERLKSDKASTSEGRKADHDKVNVDNHLRDKIQLVGRTEVHVVLKYLKTMRDKSTKEVTMIRFHPCNEEDRPSYLNMFNYFHSRDRCGVGGKKLDHVKDFFLFPLNAHTKPPKVFLPFKGPGLEELRPHLLIGIIVWDPKLRISIPINSPEYDDFDSDIEETVSSKMPVATPQQVDQTSPPHRRPSTPDSSPPDSPMPSEMQGPTTPPSSEEGTPTRKLMTRSEGVFHCNQNSEDNNNHHKNIQSTSKSSEGQWTSALQQFPQNQSNTGAQTHSNNESHISFDYDDKSQGFGSLSQQSLGLKSHIQSDPYPSSPYPTQSFQPPSLPKCPLLPSPQTQSAPSHHLLPTPNQLLTNPPLNESIFHHLGVEGYSQTSVKQCGDLNKISTQSNFDVSNFPTKISKDVDQCVNSKVIAADIPYFHGNDTSHDIQRADESTVSTQEEHIKHINPSLSKLHDPMFSDVSAESSISLLHKPDKSMVPLLNTPDEIPFLETHKTSNIPFLNMPNEIPFLETSKESNIPFLDVPDDPANSLDTPSEVAVPLSNLTQSVPFSSSSQHRITDALELDIFSLFGKQDLDLRTMSSYRPDGVPAPSLNKPLLPKPIFIENSMSGGFGMSPENPQTKSLHLNTMLSSRETANVDSSDNQLSNQQSVEKKEETKVQTGAIEVRYFGLIDNASGTEDEDDEIEVDKEDNIDPENNSSINQNDVDSDCYSPPDQNKECVDTCDINQSNRDIKQADSDTSKEDIEEIDRPAQETFWGKTESSSALVHLSNLYNDDEDSQKLSNYAEQQDNFPNYDSNVCLRDKEIVKRDTNSFDRDNETSANSDEYVDHYRSPTRYSDDGCSLPCEVIDYHHCTVEGGLQVRQYLQGNLFDRFCYPSVVSKFAFIDKGDLDQIHAPSPPKRPKIYSSQPYLSDENPAFDSRSISPVQSPHFHQRKDDMSPEYVDQNHLDDMENEITIPESCSDSFKCHSVEYDIKECASSPDIQDAKSVIQKSNKSFTVEESFEVVDTKETFRVVSSISQNNDCATGPEHNLPDHTAIMNKPDDYLQSSSETHRDFINSDFKDETESSKLMHSISNYDPVKSTCQSGVTISLGLMNMGINEVSILDSKSTKNINVNQERVLSAQTFTTHQNTLYRNRYSQRDSPMRYNAASKNDSIDSSCILKSSGNDYPVKSVLKQKVNELDGEHTEIDNINSKNLEQNKNLMSDQKKDLFENTSKSVPEIPNSNDLKRKSDIQSEEEVTVKKINVVQEPNITTNKCDSLDISKNEASYFDDERVIDDTINEIFSNIGGPKIAKQPEFNTKQSNVSQESSVLPSNVSIPCKHSDVSQPISNRLREISATDKLDEEIKAMKEQISGHITVVNEELTAKPKPSLKLKSSENSVPVVDELKPVKKTSNYHQRQTFSFTSNYLQSQVKDLSANKMAEKKAVSNTSNLSKQIPWGLNASRDEDIFKKFIQETIAPSTDIKIIDNSDEAVAPETFTKTKTFSKPKTSFETVTFSESKTSLKTMTSEPKTSLKTMTSSEPKTFPKIIISSAPLTTVAEEKVNLPEVPAPPLPPMNLMSEWFNEISPPIPFIIADEKEETLQEESYDPEAWSPSDFADD